MNITTAILTVISIFIISIPGYAGFTDSLLLSKNNSFKITDTTTSCTVVTASRISYKNVCLYDMNDSSVKILKDDVSKTLMIRDIRTIKFQGSGFWLGAAIGGGIGFAMGAIIGADGLDFSGHGSNDGSIGQAVGAGVIIGIPFALIGGGLGSLFADDKFYDLSKMDMEIKKRVVRSLLLDYSDKKRF